MTTKARTCRIVLAAHPGPGATDRVAAALASCDAATLIIAPHPGAVLDAAGVKPLVDLAQSKNVAALITDDAALSRTLRADGVHLTWSEDVVARHAEARDILGSRFIAGADAGRSRHTAMELGEAGADYVAFGIHPHEEDRATALEHRLDLVQWWADIFQPPVIGYDAGCTADAADLAATGADFICVTLPSTEATENIAAWLAPYLAALAPSHANA